MQILPFHKYQGAGNDFIMLDGFSYNFGLLDHAKIAQLCDRRFGIGADGLIILQPAQGDYAFNMLYYNADGHPGSMCGNGGRCAFRFALDLQRVEEKAVFMAIDGPHEAICNEDTTISLKMTDVTSIENTPDGNYVLNTGSPHYVKIVQHLDEVDVFKEGRAIRRSDAFVRDGINVNFVEIIPDGIRIATYERGVEDETLACGTGVTAAAIVMMETGYFNGEVKVIAKGGNLSVKAIKDPETQRYESIWLTGPAKKVFEGKIQVQ